MVDPVVHELVESRWRSGILRAVVAERIGATVDLVADIEDGTHDPRMSTLRRYATAVGAKVAWDVTVPRVLVRRIPGREPVWGVMCPWCRAEPAIHSWAGAMTEAGEHAHHCPTP